ncbi:hypothetical protein A3306_03765 [Rickettsia bellii]|uniref:Uncharacterized protein n=3 Tax=Rickettsia bellii TaxID=33990 RepID=Q1RJP5_RICBR|nr:hypothetical protein [Rickettsia bellii]ABE04419.1 unknown [Rickettsia bellii RML369-C]ARD86322.1 hypothetical protein A3306_03765 [Rickettsia bellii]KJV90118.1 hypothetical protein RBEAN4_1120 [Rickettsia bellii str. RML An4]KJV92258.1 hypothetical protein RBEMOGI_0886 [Rickettsia bellii str. RML Mogi]
MPALTDEFDKELEAIYERFDLIKNKDFMLPENQKDIQTFLMLASDYLGKNLEEKTKLSIGYLPILIKLIKIFSEINKKLSDELEESLDKVLNLYKDKEDTKEFQTEIEESLNMVKTLGLLCDENMGDF